MNETSNCTLLDNLDLFNIYEKIRYVPFAFILIALPVEYISHHHNQNHAENNIRTLSAISKVKILSNVYLIGHTFALLSLMGKFSTTFIVELASLISSLVIMRLHFRKGISSSGSLFIFWLLYLLTFTIHLWFVGMKSNSLIFYCLEIFKGIVITFIFLLNCFSDVRRRHSSLLELPSANISPECNSSFLNKIFFVWFITIAFKVNKKPITEDEIWDLNHHLTSNNLLNSFFRHINSNDETSIVWPIVKTHWTELLYTCILRLILVILFFICPFILKYMIIYTKCPNRVLADGLALAILLFVVSILIAIVNGQYLFKMNTIRLTTKSILTNIIYRKSLKMHHGEMVSRGVGNIVNLMSNDCDRFVQNILHVHMIWSGPLIIITSLVMLSGLLGIVPALTGTVVMFLVILSNFYISNKLKTLEKDQMLQKDERIKFIHETIEGIKLIKLYAWEVVFKKLIETIRTDELKILKKIAVYRALNYISWILVPVFVAITSFGIFVVINGYEQPLTVDLIFVAISLFNLMKYPLQMFPIVISGMIEARESLIRIDNFLQSMEYDKFYSLLENDNQTDNDICAIKITQGNFKWNLSAQNNTLKNINVKFKKGSIAAVVGNTASGKTSLLSAVLGEINKVSGEVIVNGTIAYVSQEAWIQSGTIQENILFGKPLNEIFYDQVIKACALDEDLLTLPNGSLTEIGERGVNLSGGQKQRISLARAIYSQANIFIFDDPLSAVDAHVKKQLFERIMSNQGILKTKTRLLVTNDYSLLNHFDQIIILKEGELIKDIANITESSEKQIKNLKLFESIDWVKREAVKNEIVEKSFHKEIKTKEQTARGKVTWDVYVSYFKYVGYKLSAFAIFMNIFYQISSLGANVWLSNWNTNVGIEQFYNSIIYCAFGIIQGISLTASTLIISFGGLKAAKNVFNALLEHTLNLPLLYFFDTPSGNIMNRFTNDIRSIDSTLPTVFRDWIGTFFTVITILVLFSYEIPVIIVFLIIIFLIYYYVLSFYLKSSRLLKRMELNSSSPIFSFFTESLNGKSIIKAFCHEERFGNQFMTKIDNHLKFAYLFCVGERCLGVILEIIGTIINFIVTISTVYYVDKMGPATATLVVTYSLQIIPYLNLMLRTSSSLETNIVAVERIIQFNSTEEELAENNSQVVANWPAKGHISYQNYSMKYKENGETILDDITTNIPALTKTSIIGRTGSGKTSMILSLFRIVEPFNGFIEIDGKKLCDISIKQIRKNISIIPQEPVFFSGSIRFNLDPLTQHSDSDIWEILKICNLKIFCQQNAAQLFHNLEKGEKISLGQKQLFCLARALLRKSKILILDEATSSLDPTTNEIIQNAIKTYCKKSTVIEVVHTLKLTTDSDKILVMEQGKIIEEDSPENLLNDQTSKYFQFLQQTQNLK